jgi:tRNA-dihydrouridine synthase B
LSDKEDSPHPVPCLPVHPDHPWLAPLAGFSDLAFRLLCRDYGCCAAFTEMISAKGLIYQTRNTLELLDTCPLDSPLIVQIYGSDPVDISRSMSILLDQGFLFFDLNCGCSVKKVLKTGSGAALLKNPGLIVEMALAMSEAAGPGRTGIKIRLGWNHEQYVFFELAEKLAGSGIGWITLHPRTAGQLFSGKACWDALKELKKTTQIPVIASGDLFTAGDALECVRRTGVDNVMFARGALNDPSVFARYINLRRDAPGPDCDRSSLREMCLKTIYYYRRYSPSGRSMLKMRTVLPRMIRDIPGAKELRKEIIMCKDWENIQKAVAKI